MFDVADVAVAARLAPGKVRAGLQHVEGLAEQNLIHLFGASGGRGANG